MLARSSARPTAREVFVEITISLAEFDSSDELRTLRSELLREDMWRGRVEFVESPPAPGTLGPVLEALRVVAEPGAVVALLTALVTWIRYRTSDIEVNVTVTDESKTVTVSGKRLRRVDAETLRSEVEHLSRQLAERPASSAAATDET